MCSISHVEIVSTSTMTYALQLPLKHMTMSVFHFSTFKGEKKCDMTINGNSWSILGSYYIVVGFVINLRIPAQRQ